MTIERLTTGDFISFSHFDPMLVEILVRFGVTGCVEPTLGFCPPVGETMFRGALFCLLSCGPFAGRAEINQFSHARFAFIAGRFWANYPRQWQRITASCQDAGIAHRGNTRLVEEPASERPVTRRLHIAAMLEN
jgi:hypothetical protein